MVPTLKTIASRLRLKQLRLLIALDEQGSLTSGMVIMKRADPAITAFHPPSAATPATVMLLPRMAFTLIKEH